MRNIVFTHYFTTGLGWENTIYQIEDFDKVEELGFNDNDGFIFIGISHTGAKHILKGFYK